jgi:Mg2+/Co2+ transporter CorB
MSELILYLVVIILSIGCSAFFSMAETAIICASTSQIHKLKSEGNKRAKTLSKLRKEKDKFISIVLLCNTAATVTASVYASNLAIILLGDEGGIIITMIMTTVLFLMAEVLPKSIAMEKADSLALSFAPIIGFLFRVLHPITHTVHIIIQFIKKPFFREEKDKISAEEELRGAIAYHHDEGDMLKYDRDMLDSILNLPNIEVNQIMVHRKNMVMFNLDDPIEDNIKNVLASPYTRIPFWQGNSDNIVGILHVRDLLNSIVNEKGDANNINLKLLLSKPWFIPETTLLSEQLEEFRKKRRHFAIVIDEYGSIMGMVTLEDILEEIVGKIEDEHDVKEDEIVLNNDGSYTIGGQVNIRTINRELEWDLPIELASTIGGLIIHQIQSIPNEGETFNFYSVEFTILKKNENQIALIKAHKVTGDNEDEEDNEES